MAKSRELGGETESEGGGCGEGGFRILKWEQDWVNFSSKCGLFGI